MKQARLISEIHDLAKEGVAQEDATVTSLGEILAEIRDLTEAEVVQFLESDELKLRAENMELKRRLKEHVERSDEMFEILMKPSASIHRLLDLTPVSGSPKLGGFLRTVKVLKALQPPVEFPAGIDRLTELLEKKFTSADFSPPGHEVAAAGAGADMVVVEVLEGRMEMMTPPPATEDASAPAT